MLKNANMQDGISLSITSGKNNLSSSVAMQHRTHQKGPRAQYLHNHFLKQEDQVKDQQSS